MTTTPRADGDGLSAADRNGEGAQARVNALVRPEIRALSAYHVGDATDMIKLDAMESPFVLSSALTAAIGTLAAEAPINRYPDPAARKLKAALSKVMAIPAGFEVLLGNGSDEIITIVTQVLARPGAVMLVPEPTFAMFRISAVIAGMRYVGVPLNADFSLDSERFLAAVDGYRPALIFLAYPNNPTGNLFPEDAIARIIARSPGLVVVDEAYFAFAGKTFMPRLSEFPNLVVMRTVSKVGMAGLRLGYAAGDRAWITELDKVRPPYNVNVLTQRVATELLAHYAELEGNARALVAERDALYEELGALPGVTPFKSEANFILVRVPNAARAFEGLKARRVLVKNFHGAHPLLDQCLRLTVGLPEENALLIEALRESCAAAGA